MVSSTPVRDIVGPSLAVAAASGVGTAVIFALFAWLARATVGEVVLGSMSASLNNASYIGIPVAIYVLGQAHYGVPVMIFQQGFLTPVFFVLADLAGSHKRPTFGTVGKTIVMNPMVLASLAGFLCAVSGFRPPTFVATSASLLGQAAPPVVLLAFGASLLGKRFSARSRQGHLIAMATVCKLILQPAIAYGTALLFGLSGRDLMGAVVMAALPTAQNAFIAALRAKTGVEIAQGVILLTTAGTLVMVVAIAWLFLRFEGV